LRDEVNGLKREAASDTIEVFAIKNQKRTNVLSLTTVIKGKRSGKSEMMFIVNRCGVRFIC
jgi:hypothetical protein